MKRELPVVVECSAARDLRAWIAEKGEIDAMLDRHGAVLFRGFELSTDEHFKDAVSAFANDPLEYVYRSTPRTALGGGVYTATEYPPGKSIPLHNENAYQREWPLKLLFFCQQPAEGGGGETPLASTSGVTERIPAAIREKFSERKLAYIRNYQPGIDVSWQDVFQTESKDEVARYCRERSIEVEWRSETYLRTRQVCDALATHPRTGEALWFNQRTSFIRPASIRGRARPWRRRSPSRILPRNVTHADGGALDEKELDVIREAFVQEMVTFPWHRGDLPRRQHAGLPRRAPFRGKRRVLVAMFDPSAAPESPRIVPSGWTEFKRGARASFDPLRSRAPKELASIERLRPAGPSRIRPLGKRSTAPSSR